MTIKELKTKLENIPENIEILLYVKSDRSVLINNEFDLKISTYIDDDENTITSVYLTSENCVNLP